MTDLTPPLALIVCDVFEQELALACAGANHIIAVETLEMGLHDHPDRLRAALQQIVSGWEDRTDIRAIAMVYGLCGCGTAGITSATHRIVIPRSHDCRAVLLGDRALFDRRLEACPGCYYFTPGWNRARRVPGPAREEMLRAEYSNKYDPDDVEFLLETDREMWHSYNTAAYIDHGTPGTENEAAFTRECADHLGWGFERLQGNLSWLRDLVWGRWDTDRFQIIEPGQRMKHQPDASIMGVEFP